jgi:hypothetical protein
VVCLLAFGLACDSASPVAPAGTLLSISASPSEITANGTSTIRVTALRANGTPINPGTIVRLDSTLGTIEDQVEINDNGTALATLRGDGRIGTATVTARAGSAETATVEVQIGEVASNVSLQATPSSIPETGGSVTLLAVVRNEEGQPLPGVSVNFTTEVGRLASGGAFLTTDSQGQATDRLTVTESDIDALPPTSNNFQVGVNAGGAAAEFEMRLESPILEADFTWSVVESDASTFTVQFTDLSRGEPTSYLWSFGDGSTDRTSNPRHQYNKGRSYNVVLKVTRGRSESTAEDQVSGPS